MANTVIQIKRSTSTATPTNGSLATAEPAYSFNSDKLFLGNSAGTGVIEVGGKYWVDTTTAAFNQANAAYNQANTGTSVTAAFAQANTARDHANAAYAQANAAPGIANSYTVTVGAAANGWANTISSTRADASNAYATAVGTAGNAYAQAVGTAGNTYAQTVGTAGNNYTITVAAAANGWANSVGADAKGYSNSTFVKLTAGNQTITGNLAVTGSLTVSGNAFSIDTETLRVSDPLIYLAGNNYVSDTVDIGFVGNYVNATGSNVHTGIFRDATNKEYYVFEGYDKEPEPNHINTAGNNFTIAVLNATLRTSNIILGGANAILTIGAAFDKANAANVLAFNTGAGANAYAQAVGTGGNNYTITVGAAANGWANTISSTRAAAANGWANTYAQTVGAAANGWANTISATRGTSSNAYAEAIGTAGNNYTITVGAAANGWANTISSTRAAASNAYAETIGAAANTNAANASYTNTGLLPVQYGGTGMTTFTTNGVLYGNTAGALKVTAAGTEGQVLQASAAGVPNFGMLDGGFF